MSDSRAYAGPGPSIHATDFPPSDLPSAGPDQSSPDPHASPPPDDIDPDSKAGYPGICAAIGQLEARIRRLHDLRVECLNEASRSLAEAQRYSREATQASRELSLLSALAAGPIQGWRLEIAPDPVSGCPVPERKSLSVEPNEELSSSFTRIREFTAGPDVERRFSPGELSNLKHWLRRYSQTPVDSIPENVRQLIDPLLLQDADPSQEGRA
jgi:hypothetical protein